MTTAFFVSDTHFGHSKILEFEKELRPFSNIDEMNEKLIENWNSVVSKRDVVYHLGDVLFGGNNFPILDRLHGVKKLILGNHDQYPVERYLQYFTKVFGYYKFDGNLLSHIPVHESQFYRFKHNLHGHLHSKKIDDERYFNCSVEQINLTPISYDEIMKCWL